MDFAQHLNRRLLKSSSSPEIEGVIQAHETAFKMQMEFSELMDYTRDPLPEHEAARLRHMLDKWLSHSLVCRGPGIGDRDPSFD